MPKKTKLARTDADLLWGSLMSDARRSFAGGEPDQHRRWAAESKGSRRFSEGLSRLSAARNKRRGRKDNQGNSISKGTGVTPSRPDC